MKSIALLSFFSAGFICSCNNNSTVTTDAATTPAPPVAKSKKACYEYINKKDTVQLSITSDGDKIDGTLVYNFFEKDKNTGTLMGQVNGDLLIADYTFMSEGVQSVRQVVFKKSGSQITEGYGDVISEDKKTRYKNLDSLDFNHSIVLKETTCK